MSLRNIIESVGQGEWINDEMDVVLTGVTERSGAYGPYWTAEAVDPQDTSYRVSMMSSTKVSNRLEENVVTLKGQGWKRGEDYNGKPQIKGGKKVQFELLGPSAGGTAPASSSASTPPKTRTKTASKTAAADPSAQQPAPDVPKENFMMNDGQTIGMAIKTAADCLIASGTMGKLLEEGKFTQTLFNVTSDVLRVSKQLSKSIIALPESKRTENKAKPGNDSSNWETSQF